MSSHVVKFSFDHLRDGNYDDWSYYMQLHLEMQEIWGFVDGTEPPLPDGVGDIARRDYERRKKRALIEIKANIDHSQIAHVREKTTAKDAWDELKAVHSRPSVAKRVKLRKQFHNTDLLEGGDIDAHINVLIQMRYRLKQLGVDVTDEEFTETVLGSLPDSYDAVITAVDAVGDLKWDKVKGILYNRSVRTDDQKSSTQSSASAFVSHNQNQKKHPAGGSSKPCHKCGKTGNLKRDCKNKGCTLCPDNSHWAASCPTLEKSKSNSQPSRQHNLRSARIANAEPETPGSDKEAVVSPDFVAAFSVSVSPAESSDKEARILDSGCTEHMGDDKAEFYNYKPFDCPRKVHVAGGRTIDALGRGSVNVVSETQGGSIELTEVLYVPNLGYKLVSVKQIQRKGGEVLFPAGEDRCEIRLNGALIAEGVAYGNLYKLKVSSKHTAMIAIQNQKFSMDRWHQRLAHLNSDYINQLCGGLAVGMKLDDQTQCSKDCEGCMLGKFQRQPFPKESTRRATRVLELIHSDVGFANLASLGGSIGYVTLIDDYSRYVVVYCIRKKSQVKRCIMDFIEKAENRHDRRVKTIRTDNGTEYVNHELQEYLSDKGIVHETTIAYTPQQNGVAERINRTLKNAALAMMFGAGVQRNLWGEALNTAVYVHNRSPTSAVKGKTPHEAWHGKKPDLSNLRSFGCLAYAYTPKELRKTLDPKAYKCIFVGYCDTKKGYRLFDLEHRKIRESRDVQFFEDKFPKLELNAPSLNQQQYRSVLYEVVDVIPQEQNVHPVGEVQEQVIVQQQQVGPEQQPLTC